MVRFGASRLICGSCEVRLASESTATRSPDEWAGIAADGANGVGHAVAAERAGIIQMDIQPGFDAGTEHERLLADDAAHRIAHDLRHAGDDGRDDAALKL